MTSIAAVVVATSMLAAQAEDRPTAKEHMQALQPFIGKWIRERTAEEDLADYGIKQGETFRDSLTYDWLFDGNAATVETIRTTKDGNMIPRLKGFLFWDPTAEKISFRWIGRYGGTGRGTYTKEQEGNWVESNEWFSPSGETGSGDGRLIFVDKDTLRRESPSGNEAVYKRVK